MIPRSAPARAIASAASPSASAVRDDDHDVGVLQLSAFTPPSSGARKNRAAPHGRSARRSTTSAAASSSATISALRPPIGRSMR